MSERATATMTATAAAMFRRFGGVYVLPLLFLLLLLLFALLSLRGAWRAGDTDGAGLALLLETSLPYAEEWSSLEGVFGAPGVVSPEFWESAEGGDVVLLNFFASWCAPCHAEHGVLAELSRSVPVAGVVWNDRADAVTRWLAREGSPFWRLGRDTGEYGRLFGVEGVPTTFVMRRGAGGLEVCERIESPLVEGSVALASLGRVMESCGAGNGDGDGDDGGAGDE